MSADDKESTEEFISLTPLGLITSILGDNRDAIILADRIELYLRRNNVAIVIDNNRLRFRFLQKTGEAK